MGQAADVARAYFDLALSSSPELPGIMAEDISWVVPERSPLGGVHRGRDAVLQMLERAFALYDPSTLKVDLPLVFGDEQWACVRFIVDAKTAKGLDWHGDYVAVFEVRDSKIQSVREYYDTERLNEVVHA
jgi:ketosteroid isomerase-like protein